jgi:hypothetical protein
MTPKHLGRAPDADGYYRACCVCLEKTLAVTTPYAICDTKDDEHNRVFASIRNLIFSNIHRLCISCLEPLIGHDDIARQIHRHCSITY